MSTEFVPGEVYRVVMVIPGVWNVPREAVMRFLSATDERLTFDLRPLAGTQDIERRHVVSVEPTDRKLCAPRKVPK